jgi:hypothetical protein
MNTETAIAHLEAFIAGGDEMGDVSEQDALEALGVLRNIRKQTLEDAAKVADRYAMGYQIVPNAISTKRNQMMWQCEGVSKNIASEIRNMANEPPREPIGAMA